MENKKAFKECFTVKGIQLPTHYYFGVTATTGDLSDNHDILSFRLYELDTPTDVSVSRYQSLVRLSLNRSKKNLVRLLRNIGII